MKIYLSDQSKYFRKHLANLKHSAIKPFDINNLVEKEFVQEINFNNEYTISEFDLSDFYNYKFFPEQIIKAYPQWIDENREMKVGDTILQQIHLPPSPFNIKMIMGVRIIQKDDLSFSYETLEGHAEIGRAKFQISQGPDSIIASIHSYSRGDNFFAKLFEKLITSPYQDFASKKALNGIKKIIESNL